MDKRLGLRFELACAWCGLLFLAIFVMCFGIFGHNLPAPPSPAWEEASTAEWVRVNRSDMQLGWVLGLIFVSLYMPWSAQISAHMARIEQHGRTMTYVQLIGGALTVFVVSLAMMFWSVATFRPDRSAETQQLLIDLGWLCLELQWALTAVQMWAMALIGLADKSAQPVFPRWVCWLTIWCGLTFAPASLTQYLKTGPFAWDGMLSYYIPYAAWLVWCGVTSCHMVADVRRRMVDA